MVNPQSTGLGLYELSLPTGAYMVSPGTPICQWPNAQYRQDANLFKTPKINKRDFVDISGWTLARHLTTDQGKHARTLECDIISG